MILGLFGNVGKFKTALATLLAYIYLCHGIPVYTNYNINFPEFEHLIYKYSLTELLQIEVSHGVILIDEVYTVAESRVSTSKVNRFFSYFIFQSRKIKVSVLYTSQLTSAVDLRLYKLTDKKIACFGLQKNNKIKFRLVYDHNGKTKQKSFSISIKVFEKWVFDHYDTYEPVDPVGLLELVVDMEKFEPAKLNKRIDDVIEVLKREYTLPKNVKKGEIEDTLLSAGYPSNLASYVAKRITNRIRPRDSRQEKTDVPLKSPSRPSLLTQLTGKSPEK